MQPLPTATSDPARAATVPREREPRGKPRRRIPEAEGDGQAPFRLGWAGWLLIDGCVVAAIFGAVIAWPAVAACRDQERRLGFYAGDALDRCIRRGIGDNLDRAEQRIKMAMRGSGP